MYDDVELKIKIEEFRPIAKELIEDKTPNDDKKMALNMSPEDAFIFGSLITSMTIEMYERYMTIT